MLQDTSQQVKQFSITDIKQCDEYRKEADSNQVLLTKL